MMGERKTDYLALGASFMLVLDEKGKCWGIGDNYKGQLGLNDIKYKHDFR